MNPNLLLRVAAVLTFAHAMLNTFAGLMSGTSKNQEEVLLLNAMKALRFDAMGSLRTYWDFYFGFGLFLTVNLLLISALLWHLATLVKVQPAIVRTFVGLLCIAFLVFAGLSGLYFFIAPLGTEAVIALLLGLVYASLGDNAKPFFCADSQRAEQSLLDFLFERTLPDTSNHATSPTFVTAPPFSRLVLWLAMSQAAMPRATLR